MIFWGYFLNIIITILTTGMWGNRFCSTECILTATRPRNLVRKIFLNWPKPGLFLLIFIILIRPGSSTKPTIDAFSNFLNFCIVEKTKISKKDAGIGQFKEREREIVGTIKIE